MKEWRKLKLLLRYSSLYEDRCSLKPKWYQFIYISRGFLEDLGEPVFETNGWEFVKDIDTGGRIYGPPVVIQLWNWFRINKYLIHKVARDLGIIYVIDGDYWINWKWRWNAI